MAEEVSEALKKLLDEQENVLGVEEDIHRAQHGFSQTLYLLGQKVGMQLLADALGVDLQDEEIQGKLVVVKERAQPSDVAEILAQVFGQEGDQSGPDKL
jgi:hypothetical protein